MTPRTRQVFTILSLAAMFSIALGGLLATQHPAQPSAAHAQTGGLQVVNNISRPDAGGEAPARTTSPDVVRYSDEESMLGLNYEVYRVSSGGGCTTADYITLVPENLCQNPPSQPQFKGRELVRRRSGAVYFYRLFKFAPIPDEVKWQDRYRDPNQEPLYPDVPHEAGNANHWQEIETASAYGLFSGRACQSNPNLSCFYPDNNLRRDEMSKNTAEAPNLATAIIAGAPHFSDVPLTHIFFDYIETAYTYRLVYGTNGRYRPSNPINRAEYAAILSRILDALLGRDQARIICREGSSSGPLVSCNVRVYRFAQNVATPDLLGVYTATDTILPAPTKFFARLTPQDERGYLAWESTVFEVNPPGGYRYLGSSASGLQAGQPEGSQWYVNRSIPGGSHFLTVWYAVPTATATATSTSTPTNTPDLTGTAAASLTACANGTLCTSTPTNTATSTPTNTPDLTGTAAASQTACASGTLCTPTPTRTPTSTATPQPSSTSAATSTTTQAAGTATSQPTATATSVATTLTDSLNLTVLLPDNNPVAGVDFNLYADTAAPADLLPRLGGGTTDLNGSLRLSLRRLADPNLRGYLLVPQPYHSYGFTVTLLGDPQRMHELAGGQVSINLQGLTTAYSGTIFYRLQASATATTSPPTATTTSVPATPTATIVPPTSTSVPPSATSIPPTATASAVTATSVAATTTVVPPTATTNAATATRSPATATTVSATATNLPATATSIAPTATTTTTLSAPTATNIPPTSTRQPLQPAAAPSATPLVISYEPKPTTVNQPVGSINPTPTPTYIVISASTGAEAPNWQLPALLLIGTLLILTTVKLVIRLHLLSKL